MYRLCGENYQPSNNLSGHSYFLNIIRIPYYFQLSNVNFELTIVTWAIKLSKQVDSILYQVLEAGKKNFLWRKKIVYRQKSVLCIHINQFNGFITQLHCNICILFYSLLLLFHLLLHTDNHQSFVVSKLFNDGYSSERKKVRNSF